MTRIAYAGFKSVDEVLKAYPRCGKYIERVVLEKIFNTLGSEYVDLICDSINDAYEAGYEDGYDEGLKECEEEVEDNDI